MGTALRAGGTCALAIGLLAAVAVRGPLAGGGEDHRPQRASTADVLVGGDLATSGHVVASGRVAVLGDLDIASGSFAVTTTEPRDGILAVGAAVTVAADAELTATSTSEVVVGTGVHGVVSSSVSRDPDAVVGFTSLASRIPSDSRCFADTPTTGTVIVGSTALRLSGDGRSSLQVFTIDSDATGRLELDGIPNGATILVNVLGDEARTLRVAGGPVTQILWNLVDARDVAVTGDALPGALMVGNPQAHTRITASRVPGLILAAGDVSLDQTELGGASFDDRALPVCDGGRVPVEVPSISAVVRDEDASTPGVPAESSTGPTNAQPSIHPTLPASASTIAPVDGQRLPVDGRASDAATPSG
jgi:choice-of-anchor A domain-containing protein